MPPPCSVHVCAQREIPESPDPDVAQGICCYLCAVAVAGAAAAAAVAVRLPGQRRRRQAHVRGAQPARVLAVRRLQRDAAHGHAGRLERGAHRRARVLLALPWRQLHLAHLRARDGRGVRSFGFF